MHSTYAHTHTHTSAHQIEESVYEDDGRSGQYRKLDELSSTIHVLLMSRHIRDRSQGSESKENWTQCITILHCSFPSDHLPQGPVALPTALTGLLPLLH